MSADTHQWNLLPNTNTLWKCTHIAQNNPQLQVYTIFQVELITCVKLPLHKYLHVLHIFISSQYRTSFGHIKDTSMIRRLNDNLVHMYFYLTSLSTFSLLSVHTKSMITPLIRNSYALNLPRFTFKVNSYYTKDNRSECDNELVMKC